MISICDTDWGMAKTEESHMSKMYTVLIFILYNIHNFDRRDFLLSLGQILPLDMGFHLCEIGLENISLLNSLGFLR